MTITEELVSNSRLTYTSLEDSGEGYVPARTELYEIAKGMADILTIRYKEDPITGKLKSVIYQTLEEYLNTLKEAGTIKDYLSLRVLKYGRDGHSADITAWVLLDHLSVINFSIRYLLGSIYK